MPGCGCLACADERAFLRRSGLPVVPALDWRGESLDWRGESLAEARP